MIYILFGHRGTGKTQLLSRLQNYFPEKICVDLDAYIEKNQGLRIDAIFAEQGEAGFRRIEEQCFQQCVELADTEARDTIIALGAGFAFALQENWFRIFVHRDSDLQARFFFDRPRLEPGKDLAEEYIERAEQRHLRYLSFCDFAYHMPEGFDFPNESERLLFANLFGEASTTVPNSMYVLSATEMMRVFEQRNFSLKLQKFPVERLELRTDFIKDPMNLMRLVQGIGHAKVLLSYRDPDTYESVSKFMPSSLSVDVDIELLKIATPSQQVAILSAHPPENLPVLEVLAELEKQGEKFPAAKLKIAWQAKSLAEIDEVYRWQQQEPARRCMFPISPVGGNYQDVRLLLGQQQSLQIVDNPYLYFFRDQPDLLRAAMLQTRHVRHAVLGEPVQHSQSPAVHFAALQEENSFLVKIAVEKGQLTEQLAILRQWGMDRFAITAPLKKEAFELATRPSTRAMRLQTANTLALVGDEIYADNTDLWGLAKQVETEGLAEYSTMVWGGGGTLPILREIFPQAAFYSARSAELRPGSAMIESPELLVVAIQNEDLLAGAQPPPVLTSIRILLDLSYRENSFAKRLAIEQGWRYIGGQDFLRYQAEEQRRFWRQWS